MASASQYPIDFNIHFMDSTYSNKKAPSRDTPNVGTLPLEAVEEPHANDVLSGVGAVCSSHPGNRYLRKLVEAMKESYQLRSSKDDKTNISQCLVNFICARNPPGRFLAKCNHDDKLWYDIGMKKARLLVVRRLRRRSKHIKVNTKKDEMEKPSPILSPCVNRQDSKTDVASVSQVSAVKPQGNTKDVIQLHQNYNRNNRNFDDKIDKFFRHICSSIRKIEDTYREKEIMK
mmetsp:Transcript_35472/g.82312  ORF Transcript_35472/g.82312 Transcript_35472/m.82312 type:complete len:231 (-) Transcript_35472:96-788(-)